MRNYHIMPHVADLRIKIEGDSLVELFNAGLDGMTEYIAPSICRSSNTKIIEKKIQISSTDLTALLIDFLSEVLTIMYTERAVFCRVVFLKLETNILTAELRGFSNVEFKKDIKAVTYHEAEIIKIDQDNYQTNLVFDI